MVANINTRLKSLFDTDIEPRKLAKKIKDLGMTAMVVTDLGELTAIETARETCNEKDINLKFIPGVTVLLDIADNPWELILIAKDDIGYRAICNIVTESNEHIDSLRRPHVTIELLNKHIGNKTTGYNHVFITTSGKDGYLAGLFFQNTTKEKQIQNLREQRDLHIPESDSRVQNTMLTLSEIMVSINSLEAIIKEKKKTKLDFCEEKKELDVKRKTKRKIESMLREFKKDIDIYEKIDQEINDLVKTLIPDELLKTNVENALIELQSIFGNKNVLVELQYHGFEEEKQFYPILVNIAKKVKCPLIASNSVRMLTNSEEELLKRDLLRSMGNEDEDLFLEHTKPEEEMYLKSKDELSQMLLRLFSKEDVNKAFNNIAILIDSCNVKMECSNHYPVYPTDTGLTSDELLEKEAWDGLNRIFPEGIPEAYKERLKREFKVIESMGYSDYHLIVKDFLEYGRLLGYVPKEKYEEVPLTINGLKQYILDNNYQNGGLPIGPGRGSGAGSLVCYSLGITSIDPLKYGLLFERFLNPERVSMPDIDSDLAYDVREKTIEYVKAKYGINAVCNIMTMNAMAPKGAIRKVAKYYGLRTCNNAKKFLPLADKIAKTVPNELGLKFDKKPEGLEQTLYNYLVDQFSNNEDALGLLKYAKAIEGAFTVYGVHAAGIVISDNKRVADYIPLRKNKNELWTTQCNMAQTESNGLLKMDFLGLKTLNVISDTLKLIEKTKGIIIEPLKLVFADDNVFQKIFQTGNTVKVFQLESDGMRQMLRDFKPKTFEDLIILISMYRPGPKQYLDDVIAVKNGRKEMQFITPELERITGKTYGAIIYQEQVMEICQKLAGYSLGQADNIRRYMSKKKEDKLVHERNAFIYGDTKRQIIGCIKNGIKEDAAATIFDQMVDFAKYAFNKSHAASYATLSYLTAWLKCYYPAEFYAANLNWAADINDIAKIMMDGHNNNVKFNTPDINTSRKEFVILSDDVQFTLSGIKSVGSSADLIIEERNANGLYKSFADFYFRSNADSKVCINLIRAGAFDALNNNRESLEAMVDIYKDYKDALKKERKTIDIQSRIMNIEKKATSPIEFENLQMQEFGKILYKRQAAKEIREEKIRDAKRKIHEIECEIKETEQLFNDVTYIPLERLNKERAVLGAYVSGHPMASISTPYKTCSLSDDSTRVDGVAVDIEIKRRKSDQRPMAFFYIEDQGGKIRASLFTKAFEKCGDKLLEGQIYKFYGKVQIKKDIKIEIDENGEEKIIENIVKEFFVENIELYPVIEKEIFLIGNSSWNREEFVTQNCLLKKNHSAETGRKGVVFMNGVILDVPFAINENILTNNKTDYQVCEEIPY